MLRLVVECGEYFGVSREEQLGLLSDPSQFGKRWGAIDWGDFYRLMRRILRNAGTGEDLLEAGRRYRRDCYLERTDHLVWQFLSWDRMIWATKHFLVPRTIRGSALDYKRLGHRFFHVRLSIPEDYESEEDLLYLYVGVMTNGGPLENARHEVSNLVITAHSAEFDVLFGRRSWKARLAFNPFSARRKSLEDLREANESLLGQQLELRRKTDLLEHAFDAVSDRVFVVREGTVTRTNRPARSLLDAGPVDWARLERTASSGSRLEWAGRPHLVRANAPIDTPQGPARLVTLRDLTEEEEREKRRRESLDTERGRTSAELEEALGADLRLLRKRLETLRAESPDDARPGSLAALADSCVAESRAIALSGPTGVGSREEFAEALARLAEDFRNHFRFPVEVRVDRLPDLEEGAAWENLFLVLREGLRNAWRHSGAKGASVVFAADRIELLDDGTGLSPECLRSGGIGLQSIGERCRRIGLAAGIAPPPRNGWIFRIHERTEHGPRPETEP